MTNNVKKRSVSPNCISPISRGIFGKDILNNVIQTNQNNNNVLEMINC